MKPQITEILVKDFRNHALWRASFERRHVLFFGRNGAGKTSVLEAISKLAPGLGIRSARNTDIIRVGAASWEVGLKFSNGGSVTEIGMSYSLDKRIIKVNKEPINNFKKVLDLVKVMWFTPQMGNVFTTDKSVRRKFFDRLVALSNPQHLENLMIYEHCKSERLKILATRSSEVWLGVNEKKLAELCIVIANARESFIKFLTSNSTPSSFASSEIRLLCPVVEVIDGIIDSDEQMHRVLKALSESREKDIVTGKMQFGVHRTDFFVTGKQKEGSAKNSSTGEQKSLILGIILAVSELIDIMLLDDIFAHLDQEHLTSFLGEAMQKNCQFFFSDLEGNKVAQFDNLIQTVPV